MLLTPIPHTFRPNFQPYMMCTFTLLSTEPPLTRLASIAELPATITRHPDAVRVAQIGLAGGIGFCHLNEYSHNPHFKYIGGYDLYPQEPKVTEASTRVRQMGGRIYGSFEEVLADPHVEAIDICTPHHFHRPMAVAAFKAGKHVLVEKPMATHPDELALMLQAQQASGKVGAVQMQHIGRSSMLDLRAAIQQGAIGQLKEVFLSSLWWREENYYSRLPWAGRIKVDGAWCVDGALFNQCVHFITQMLILAAPPPPAAPPAPTPQNPAAITVARVKDLRCAMYKFHQTPTLDAGDTAFAVGTIEAPGNPRLTLVGTTCSTQEQHQIELIGTKGRALWNGTGYLFVDGQSMREFQDDNRDFDGTSRIFTSWARAIRQGGKPLTDFAAIAPAAEFISNCYTASNWQIKNAPWSATESLFSQVIQQAFTARALPTELQPKPDWA